MNDVYQEGPKTYDKIAEQTGLLREACKALVLAMIYGGPVISICKRYELSMIDIVNIRMTFDDIMGGKIEIS